MLHRTIYLHTDLEALHIRQQRLRLDRSFLCSIDLKALHHIQLYLGGLRTDFIGSAPLRLCPQLVRRYLTWSRSM